MAVTSVDIDAEILHQVKATFGVKTNREAIDLALHEVVMRRRQLDAIDSIAAISLDADAQTISYGD